jgi:hypothetical protein
MSHASHLPLAIIGTHAITSLGLSARACGAAFWSRAARFELTSGVPFGLDDALRVSPCPLFDATTPWAERTDALYRAALLAFPPEPNETWLISHHVAASLPQHDPAGLKTRAFTGPCAFDTAFAQANALLQTAPVGHTVVLLGLDSLLGAERLLHGAEARPLSTEASPEGVIPGEAAACLRLCTPESALFLQARVLGTLSVSSAQAPAGSGANALTQAVTEVLGPTPVEGARTETLLWQALDSEDLSPLATMLGDLHPKLPGLQLVRPMQFLGDVGLAMAAVAVVLALEGARTGVLAGPRSLIATWHQHGATALLVDAPWHPSILLADAHCEEP